jgi:hypothetical protein
MKIEIDENGLTIINGKFGPLKPNLEAFYAKRGCGCCTAKMMFKDERSIREAFKRAGLSFADITDDSGVTHREIDTFYGWSRNQEEQGERSLGYLVSLIP